MYHYSFLRCFGTRFGGFVIPFRWFCGYIVMLRARMFRSLIIRTGIKERNIRARNITYNRFCYLFWSFLWLRPFRFDGFVSAFRVLVHACWVTCTCLESVTCLHLVCLLVCSIYQWYVTRLARLTSAGSRKFCLRLLGCQPGCTIIYGRLKICPHYQATGSRIFSDEKLPKLHSIPSILLNLPF